MAEISIKSCTSRRFIFSVEDTDDLVPIFNRQSDMLKHTYGDYFLAELIEAQDDHMKCIVAEVSTHPYVHKSFGVSWFNM